VRDAEAAEVKAKQARTQFGRSAAEDEADGYGKYPEPVVLRDLAARRLTGKGSYHTFDRVLEIEELSQNPDVPEGLRALAATQLEEVRTTKHVTTPYAVVKKEEALLAIAAALASEGLPTTFEEELAIRRHQLETAVGSVKIMAVAKAALKRANEVRKRKGNYVAELVVGRQPPRDPARWVPRALLAIVGDTDYWWLHLDPAEVGSAMKPDQWEQFEDWVHNAVEFRNAARPFRRG
jgi:ParB family chromosome partitioning protein